MFTAQASTIMKTQTIINDAVHITISAREFCETHWTREIVITDYDDNEYAIRIFANGNEGDDLLKVDL
jgi:hypothetical protein